MKNQDRFILYKIDVMNEIMLESKKYVTCVIFYQDLKTME
jgi:hypothetical protein